MTFGGPACHEASQGGKKQDEISSTLLGRSEEGMGEGKGISLTGGE